MSHESLERLRKLSSDYGDDLLREICHIFCTSVADQISLLERNIKKGDLTGIQFFGHKMKSSGANLGLKKFADLCEYFENLSCEAPEHETWRIFLELKTEYERATHLIGTFLEMLFKR